jgi:hypothetical protein
MLTGKLKLLPELDEGRTFESIRELRARGVFYVRLRNIIRDSLPDPRESSVRFAAQTFAESFGFRTRQSNTPFDADRYKFIDTPVSPTTVPSHVP